MRRIIVTGGAGFIGANLVRHIEREYPVTRIVVIDDLSNGVFSNLTPAGDAGPPFRSRLIARPLEDVDLHKLAAEFKPEVIFHEAAITDTTVTDEAAMMIENVEPFETLIDVARTTGARLVWASSAATYGTEANGATAARRPFALGDAGRPANVYGFSKWVMENLHRHMQAEHPDLHIVGLRYFNVYGPGEAHKEHMASMVYQLACQMLAGKRPRIFYDGTQARDQVHVSDVVAATIAAAGGNAASGIYNVGSGVATTFNEIVAALNNALDTDFEPDYFENPYPFYQDYTCADLSETVSGLHWKPQCEPEAGIEAYARWLKQRHALRGRRLEGAIAS